MAINKLFFYSLAFTLLFTLSISSDPAHITPSPAPSPVSGSDDQPPLDSPPVPPPASDLPSLPPSPASPPSISNSPPPDESPSPQSPVADVSGANLKTEDSNETKSSGMSSGKKAGIAIGVIGAACVVGFAGVLYKKRQQNIRRAEFSSAARREFL